MALVAQSARSSQATAGRLHGGCSGAAAGAPEYAGIEPQMIEMQCRLVYCAQLRLFGSFKSISYTTAPNILLIFFKWEGRVVAILGTDIPPPAYRQGQVQGQHF